MVLRDLLQLQSDDQKQQGIDDKFDHLPKAVQGLAGLVGHRVDLAVVADNHSGDHDGDNPGEVKGLGQQRRPEGDDHGDRDLQQVIVQPFEQMIGPDPNGNPDYGPAAGHHQELGQRVTEVELGLTVDHFQNDHEDHHAGPVIEQALPFQYRAQPFGRADPAQDRKHRNRIGRGDDRPEEHRVYEGNVQKMMREQSDQQSRDHHARKGQQDDRAPILLEVSQVHVQRPVKKERRQDESENNIVGNNDVRCEVENGHHKPYQHQGDGIRLLEPLRDNRHRAGDHQKECDFAD